MDFEPAQPAGADLHEDTVWKEKQSYVDLVPRPLLILALGAVLIGAWQLLVLSGAVPAIILPSPLATIKQVIFVGGNLISGGYILDALWITTQEVLAGFALAAGIGITLGIVVGETRIGERALMPYLVAIDTMPKIAFAPLFVAWFGFALASKIALATFMAVFPIIVGTAAGLHAAEANARMLFDTMGASRWQTLVKLKLPEALPQMFTGLKIGALSVMAGAITGEFMGGGKGMGELIRVAATQLDTARVFALIICLSFVGLALFALVSLCERKIVFWRQSTNLHV